MTEAKVEQVSDSRDLPMGRLTAQGSVGGALMGLANLVPGISGGTMLLAAGVYEAFILAIAEVTRFRFRTRSLLLLGVVLGAALITIVALAGPVKDLVVSHRWAMYSLFIGLTLGGVPILYRMIGRIGAREMIAIAAGFAFMVAMLLIRPAESDDGATNYVMLAIAGVAGASAMVLPGVSGAYLLLVLGQYVPILVGIDHLRQYLRPEEGGRDVADLITALHVCVPVGIGVVLGVVIISNLIRLLLTRLEKPTLGVLMGLLLGAVVGIYPFQQYVQPALGTQFRGVTLETIEQIEGIDPQDYRDREFFTPSVGQAALSFALMGTGFAATQAVGLLGRRKKPREDRTDAEHSQEPSRLGDHE